MNFRKIPIIISILYFLFGIAWIFITRFLYNKYSFENELIADNVWLIKDFSILIFSLFLFYFLLINVLKKQSGIENHFKMFFDESPFPMWIYDSKTLKFLEINRAALYIYGFTKSEFLKMNILEIIPEESAAVLKNCLEKGDRIEIEKGISIHVNKSKERFITDVHSYSVNHFGREAVHVIALNVHEQIENEKRNYELQSKNINHENNLKEIAWIQSHKLRAPLANILGLIQIFNHENPADEKNGYIINKLQKVSIELDKIINEIVKKSNKE